MPFWQRLKHHFVPTPQNAYRPHLLGRSWLTFFLAAVLATEGFLVASLVAHQSNGSFLAAVVQADIISLTNNERVENNDGTLAENAQLDAAAQAKAKDMAAKDYFSHTSPDGKTPWQWINGSGYAYRFAGENLAVRFDDSQSVVNAWMASPTHRANIVKPQYTQIGVGVAEGLYEGMPATFVVQYFGTPLASAVSVPSAALGASVSVPQQVNSVMRQLLKIFDNSPSEAGWILGGIATLLILILGLTFVMHLQVQPTDLLLPGFAVAAVALFLLAFNGTIIGDAGAQPAAVGAAHASGIILGPNAAATGL